MATTDKRNYQSYLFFKAKNQQTEQNTCTLSSSGPFNDSDYNSSAYFYPKATLYR